MPEWVAIVLAGAGAFTLGAMLAEMQLNAYCRKLEGRCFGRLLEKEKLRKENDRLRARLAVITEEVES